MMTFEGKVQGQLTASEIAALRQSANDLHTLVMEHGVAFAPRADYDKELDCIRVIVRDCSPCEYRITPWLTVWHDTDPESAPGPVGFTLKGIRELVTKP